MKIKEAIDNLYYLINNEDCTGIEEDYYEEIEISILALEKCKPEKPVMLTDGYGDTYEGCLMCKQPLTGIWNFDDYKPQYCPNCGQRLDWSNENG